MIYNRIKSKVSQKQSKSFYNMNYDELVNLRQMNVAWILLRADNAPLIISFLHKTFIEPNKRDIAKNILENLLEIF